VTGGGAAGAKGEDRGKRDRTPYARRAQNRRNAYERLIAAVTLAAIDPRWEPYAGKPHVRICAGALSNERPYRDHLIRPEQGAW
jgi:hypothetical protein